MSLHASRLLSCKEAIVRAIMSHPGPGVFEVGERAHLWDPFRAELTSTSNQPPFLPFLSNMSFPPDTPAKVTQEAVPVPLATPSEAVPTHVPVPEPKGPVVQTDERSVHSHSSVAGLLADLLP